ncbi:MAG: lipopolysaccharide biosynthesis protein [Chloroflexota bacterium]|nr:lipopolysaccharide biosynthesis protein [Chloroflexota bacterium]
MPEFCIMAASPSTCFVPIKAGHAEDWSQIREMKFKWCRQRESCRLASVLVDKLALFSHNQQAQLIIRLFRNASVYGVGIILVKIGGVILLPIYLSRLTPEDYGILGLVAIASGFLTPILNLGLSVSVGRLYLEWSPSERPHYVAATWITSRLFGFCLILFLDRIGAYIFPVLISQVPFTPYIRMVLWTTYLNEYSSFPFSILRVTERLQLFTLASVGSFLVIAGLTIYLVVVRGMGATGVLLANLVNAGIGAVLWSVFMWIREIKFPFGWMHLKEPISFGLPSVPSTIIDSVGGVLDRFFLDKFVPLSGVGLYSLGKQFGSYVGQINGALKSSWIPLTYRLASEQPESLPELLPKISVVYVAAMAWATSAITLLGSDLIELSGAKRFVGAYHLIPLFTLSYFVLASGSGLGRGLDIAKDLRLSPVVPAVSIVVNFVTTILLVRPFGAEGVALAFFLTALTTTIVHIYLAHKVYPRRFPFIQIIMIVASGVLVFLIGSHFAPEPIWPRIIVKGTWLLVYVFVLLGIAIGPVTRKGRRARLRNSI